MKLYFVVKLGINLGQKHSRSWGICIQGNQSQKGASLQAVKEAIFIQICDKWGHMPPIPSVPTSISLDFSEYIINTLQTGKFVFCTRKIFSPSNLRTLKNRPHIFSPSEEVYFSSISFKFCALDWALRAWQFACARKIFSAHYILSSLEYTVVYSC